MEKLLQEILNELKGLKQGQKGLKESQKELKVSQKELKESQVRIESKLDSVYNHTARITIDITETNMKLDEVIDDIDYVKHKENKKEEDLYKLKKNLKIVK